MLDDRSLDALTLNEGLTDEMWELVRRSADLPAAVERAVEALELSVITHELFELSQKFNSFYHKYPILNEKDDAERQAARFAQRCSAGRCARHWSCWPFQCPSDVGMKRFLVLALLLASSARRMDAVRCADRRFRISFPISPPHIRYLGRRTDYSQNDGRNTFMVEVVDDPMYSLDRAAKILRDYPNPGASGIHGRVVASSPLTMPGAVGREVRIEGTINSARGKVTELTDAYVTNGRLYLVTVAAAPGYPLASQARQFLDSFQIVR
jgi:hypothetical protein